MPTQYDLSSPQQALKTKAQWAEEAKKRWFGEEGGERRSNEETGDMLALGPTIKAQVLRFIKTSEGWKLNVWERGK